MPVPGDTLASGHRLIRRMASPGAWLAVDPHRPKRPLLALEPGHPSPRPSAQREELARMEAPPDARLEWADGQQASAWRLDGAELLSECVGPWEGDRSNVLERDLVRLLDAGARVGLTLSPEHLLWRPGSLRLLPGAHLGAPAGRHDRHQLLRWLDPPSIESDRFRYGDDRKPVPTIAGTCHMGLARACNEDMLAWKGIGRSRVVAIADGTGGWHHGPRIADVAVETLVASFTHDPAGPDEAEEMLRAGYARARAALIAERAEGGATIVAAWVGRREAVLLHIGETMAWRSRNQTLTRLVEEHTLGRKLVREHGVSPDDPRVAQHRNIVLRNLSTQAQDPDDVVTPDLHRVSLWPGDRLLLATDGLTEHVPDATIREILGGWWRVPRPRPAVRNLLLAAVAAGATDNLAVALVDM